MHPSLHVLFAVWELDPYFKVGGLGDVARSLPTALKEKGVDIRITIPYYDAVRVGHNKKTVIADFDVSYEGKKQTVAVVETIHPIGKNPVYLLRNSRYFSTAVFPDTYAFFAKAIVTMIEKNILSWKPDIIHCNDVHTGLIPLLIREGGHPIKTMMTIHNLMHQGKASIDVIERLDIDLTHCKVLDWEIRSKKINFLAEGIIHADVVTTVSPTYAKEIMTEEFGVGLEELLRGKEGRIFGILNGIDTKLNHAMHEKIIRYPYRVGAWLDPVTSDTKLSSWKEGKKMNKKFLQKKLGLKIDPNLPLFSFIGRFDVNQKGIDILHKMLRRIIDSGKTEWVILGSGSPEWEERYLWFGKFYPKHISCNFRFDDVLAKQIYAASDFLVIPSKFEPCGLIQMFAMSFGTLPIAHRVGGLTDSIQDDRNGFFFDEYSSEALEVVVNKAISLWKTNKIQYAHMVESALETDFSWNKSAQEYLALYQKLLDNSL